LAQAIVKEGLKNVAAGANPMDLKRGIDKAVEAIVADLAKQAKVVGSDSEKIKQIASISANNDEVIGELIATAFAKVGKGIESIDTIVATRHTRHTDVVHGEKHRVYPDERKPEVNVPKLFIHHSTKHFGEPMIYTCK